MKNFFLFCLLSTFFSNAVYAQINDMPNSEMDQPMMPDQANRMLQDYTPPEPVGGFIEEKEKKKQLSRKQKNQPQKRSN